jgi:hypothetical protein
VCGQTTIDGEDEDFQLFYDLFGADPDEEGCAVTTKYEVDDAMTYHKLVWSEQWDTPIHKKCSKKAACKCVVPIGATVCPKHQWPVERVRVQAPVRDSEAKKQQAGGAAVEKAVEEGAKPKAVIMLKKVDWLPSATMTTRATGFVSTENKKKMEKKVFPVTHPGVYKQPTGGVAGKGGGGYVPAPSAKELEKMASKKKKAASLASSRAVVVKPDTKTLRLKEAAAKCVLKIDQWADVIPPSPSDGNGCGKEKTKERETVVTETEPIVYAFPISDWMKQHPVNARLDKETRPQTEETVEKKPSVLKIHLERFDPYLHGYWEVGGVSVYRRGDGGEQRVTCGVNTIHDDGTLTPLV